MENITIEKMEIKRFNALLMRTIVGMLFMGVLMWETFCLDTGKMGLLVYCFGDFFNLSVRMGALVIVVVAMLFSEIRRLLLYNPYKDGK